LLDDPSRRAFPLPEVIARSRETTLRKLGLGYRSPYLLQLARGVVAGKFDLESLRDPSRPTEEVRRDLLALPGIGPYAAATLLGILGRYDFIGVDTEAMSLVSKGFYGGQPIGTKEIEAVFARWGKFKSLAYWFWDWAGQQQSPMEAYEERLSVDAAQSG
jgi:3-methyladenine DNA glycosylase/8-oxoguanine DNA glycosylase